MHTRTRNQILSAVLASVTAALIVSPADPNAACAVKVDGSYLKPFKHALMHEERPARRPTGADQEDGAGNQGCILPERPAGKRLKETVHTVGNPI